MNLNNVSITVSAVDRSQYPKTGLTEVAFAGRSNVGKSSFINKILNRKSLARVSSKPGKTATINFYDIDNTFYLVDLPGYGYAKVSKQEKKKWGEMIDTYLAVSENLAQVVLLVDLRHTPTEDDKTMLRYIKTVCDRAVVVATKADKVKKSEFTDRVRDVIGTLALSADDIIIPFSSVTGEGVDEFWCYVSEVLGIE